MGLQSFYSQTLKTTNLKQQNSPIYETHNFTLKIDKSDLKYEETELIDNDLVITGIVNEMPEISYDMEWDLSPVATLTNKVQEFTSHKLLRAFAENSEDYRPPLFTDGWTQKMPKTGSPLSVDITFKSYPIWMYNTTSYKEILKFLFFATTPREYNISDSVAYIDTALDNAEAKGNMFGSAVTTLKTAIENKGDDKSILDIARIITSDEKILSGKDKELKDAFDILWKGLDEIGQGTDLNIGGAPLCTFNIGGIIKSSSRIKWLIKNWSFKPALNVTYQNEKLEPIYVDFKISLETQMVLTNSDLELLLG